MKTTLLLVSVLLLAAAAPRVEQEPAVVTPPAAARKDVATLDGIMAAVYDSISGAAGEKRDWSRFHSLFHPDMARLQPVVPRGNGNAELRAMTPMEYESMAAGIFAQQPFYESEAHRSVEQFGHIAHVFSTYESRRERNAKPFQRGINSMQLFHDGERWWILSILWDAEGPGQSIPAGYLPE